IANSVFGATGDTFANYIAQTSTNRTTIAGSVDPGWTTLPGRLADYQVSGHYTARAYADIASAQLNLPPFAAPATLPLYTITANVLVGGIVNEDNGDNLIIQGGDGPTVTG